jgi:hypothetical protein
MLVELEAYPSARFTLLMALSISWVLLKPIVALATAGFLKSNLITFARHSMHYRSSVNPRIREFFSKAELPNSM